MIYIQEEDKENIHPNVMHNQKSVQFSNKLKRYNNDTLTFSSDNSCQGTGSKESRPQKILLNNQSTSQQSNHKPHHPEVSHFDINELHRISKQISLKDVSNIYTTKESFLKNKVKKQWVKSIMQPSNAELKLLQKIQGMLQKQSFKPTYSTIKGFRKQYYSNTMNTDEKLISQGRSMFKQSVQHSKAKSPAAQSNKSTLSDLINFSRLSGISSKTLQKYLLCLEKENLKQLQKSQKVSEFSLIDTQRSKQVKNQHIQQNNKLHNKPEINHEIQNKYIIELYSLIKGTQKNAFDSINRDTDKMVQQIKEFILNSIGKVAKQQDSTCLLQD